MSNALFSGLDLAAAGRPGFRLTRLEVLNWGTFHRRVWRLDPGGETTLLTGDIGSGKSTLVDAVSTLMLPAHRIDYNKAAGANRKERTLRSYVEGHHKTERDEKTGSVRPVALRGRNSYSVILGVFTNEGFDATVTLAQIFQQQDSAGQPWRRFVTAEADLTIDTDFVDFGSDLGDLLKRLRRRGAVVDKDFPPYGRAMRRLLGIRSEQAMELFHQTISMKAVGDLNEFVRTHMLEPTDTRDRIDAIIRHFEDLTRAHDAVRRAREQLDALMPLVDLAERYDAALTRRDALQEESEALAPYFSELRIEMRADEIERLDGAIEEIDARLKEVRGERTRLAGERDTLIEAKAKAGGDRVGQLEREAKLARDQMGERTSRRQNFDAAVAKSGHPAIADAHGFAELTGRLQQVRDELETETADLGARYRDAVLEHGEVKKRLGEVERELEGLAGRRNNLPSEQLELRDQLCTTLGVDEPELQFAGELLDVAEPHAEWRGAAERVLYGFAVSLLVPQRLYAEVAEWVDSRRLTARRADGREIGVRLTYERVPDRRMQLRRPHIDGLILADTIEIADTPLQDYLQNELYRRADHVCADTVEEFRQAQRAVTRAGQVRAKDRHVKDDRRAIDDASGWVLGWRTERKIASLESRRETLAPEVHELAVEIERVEAERRAVADRRSSLEALEQYSSWTDLDWEEAEARAESATRELDRLLAGSSELAEVQQRLDDVDATSKELSAIETTLVGEQGGLSTRLDEQKRRLEGDDAALKALGEAALDIARAIYPRITSALGPMEVDSAEATFEHERRRRDEVGNEVQRTNRELNAHTTNLQQAMSEVRRRWPEQTTEMDVSVEARREYIAFHERVAGDDLPRFEAEFARQLKTNAIRELAGLQNWLRRQADDISEKVERINEALGAIDFNPGRYVRLDTEDTVNQYVRQFRADLREVTDDVIGDGDHYSEERYEAVHAVLDRLRGREGHTDADRSWRAHVTDVRNWFTFSASERYRDGDGEFEHYRDSDGKSGGQKEKLAYTILAASLAYQFGLEWGVEKARDFRFAVIDEAFGRGSDASTRYALELFAKLGLQLLIVTPLQKVHVIAPYVRSIGFVDNVEGRDSRLVPMSTEEYLDKSGRAG